MIEFKPTISTVTLSVNCLCTPGKYRNSQIEQTNDNHMHSRRDHFTYNDIIRLKVKEWIKTCMKTPIQNNNNGSVTLISESIDFRRNITREEKIYYTMVKGVNSSRRHNNPNYLYR